MSMNLHNKGFGDLRSNSSSTISDPNEDIITSLQDELQNLHKRFDLHKQLMDLFVMDAIDKYKYVRISTMLTSVDKETVNMAEQIVVQLHTKWIRKTMEGRVIELPEVSSVGNNSLLTD